MAQHDNGISLTLGDARGGMLTITGTDQETFFSNLEAVRNAVYEDPTNPMGAFLVVTQPQAVAAVTQAFDAQPAQVQPVPASGVSKYGEPCAVCGVPKTRIITPRPGQTWPPFAACQDKNHRG